MSSNIKHILLVILSVLTQCSLAFGQNCIYPNSSIYIQNLDCSIEQEFCIDIPYGDRSNYDISVDGSLYMGSITPCNYDTFSFYNAIGIQSYLDANPVVDMIVDSVRINGQLHSFTFESLEGLTDSLNLRDITSAWSLNALSNIVHEHNNSIYSDIYYHDQITAITPSIAEFQRRFSPKGLIISITNGVHEIILNETATTCSDTITVESYCSNNIAYLDTIILDQIDTTCLDLIDLRGNLVNIENICPQKSGMNAFINPINGTACLELMGLEIGRDSACIVVTDDLGLTDTISYIIEVIAPPTEPDSFTAVNDSAYTTMEQPMTFDPRLNDAIPNLIDTMYISTPPNHGTAVINADGTISYQPDMGYLSMGIPDSLIYTICSMSDCRTATVRISVDSPIIEVPGGFSPNQDGINDLFHIANLENFPSNQLHIFNRWGNRVVNEMNYQNDWSGNWDGDQDLPNGTYFYILTIDEGSTTMDFSGYVQIMR